MSASYRYGGTGRQHIGEHRMSWREARWQRAELRKVWPAQARAALVWAELLDWLLVPWRNLLSSLREAKPPVCDTCRFGQHRGCGMFDDDPPCGCGCPAGQSGRLT